jgi:DeoR/GlpR family transcriptional regulator of sugar metabolism
MRSENKLMLSFERIKEIAQQIKKNNAVTVKELAAKFYTSESTIRRDLVNLEKIGIVKRTYGGAILLEGLDAEIPFLVRENEQKTAKEKIGALAAGFVENNKVIFLDSSSSVLHMIPYLKGFERLTIISNGARTVIKCSEALNAKIYSTGGLLRENSMSYVGETAKRCVSSFYTDILFFSCRALSIDKGLTDISEEEAELRKLMITNSKKTILLLDSSKFNTIAFCNIIDISAIDVLITDKMPNEEWMQILGSNNVEVVYPS